MGSVSETPSTPEPSFAANMFGTDDDAEDEDSDFDFAFDTEEADEAVASAGDVPDWLSGMSSVSETPATPEPSFAANMFGTDDDAEDEDSDFDFAFDAEADDEAVAADVPDWLSGMGSVSETPSTPEPSFAANMFGTDDDAEDEDSDFDFAFDAEAEEEPAVAGDVPDWLSGIGTPNDHEVPATTPVPSFAASMLGGDDDDETDDDFDFELEDVEAAAEDAPDWLSAVAPASAISSSNDLDDRQMVTPAASLFDDDDNADALDFSWETEETDEPAQASASMNWLSGSGSDLDDDESTELEEATPNWLSSVRDTPDTDPDADSDDFIFADEDADEAVAGDVPDWLSGIGTNHDDGDSADELDWELKPETVNAADSFDLGDEFADDEAEDTLVEELASTPAANAPDWLNAMVPGLDVDFEESESSELEPVAPVASAPKADFNWLKTIVDEELAPPTSLPPAARIAQAASTAMSSGVKYAFSRPPAWLRRLRGETGGSTVSALTIEPKALEDDDDLPPWLQFDSENDQ
jgi:hypothetical protein